MGRRVMKPEEIISAISTDEDSKPTYDLSMIVATDAYGVIGAHWSTKLLWHYPNDLKRFREVTMGKTIVMGVQTHKDIGRVLPGRRNIVLAQYGRGFKPKHEGVEVCYNPLEILELAKTEPVVIIGGLSVYDLFYYFIGKIYYTRIHGIYNGTIRFNLRNHRIFRLEETKTFPADENHLYPYSFDTLSMGADTLEKIKYWAAEYFANSNKGTKWEKTCTEVVNDLNKYLTLLEGKPIIDLKVEYENNLANLEANPWCCRD